MDTVGNSICTGSIISLYSQCFHSVVLCIATSINKSSKTPGEYIYNYNKQKFNLAKIQNANSTEEASTKITIVIKGVWSEMTQIGYMSTEKDIWDDEFEIMHRLKTGVAHPYILVYFLLVFGGLTASIVISHVIFTNMQQSLELDKSLEGFVDRYLVYRDLCQVSYPTEKLAWLIQMTSKLGHALVLVGVTNTIGSVFYYTLGRFSNNTHVYCDA